MNAKKIRIAALVILLVGAVTGGAIYVVVPPAERLGILGVDIRTNRDRNQLERMGGKTYVMAKDFDEWFATLWHGRRLGGTIGTLSVLAFLVGRGLARVQEDHHREVAANAAAAEKRE